MYDCPVCTRPWVSSEHCKTTNIDVELQAWGKVVEKQGGDAGLATLIPLEERGVDTDLDFYPASPC